MTYVSRGNKNKLIKTNSLKIYLFRRFSKNIFWLPHGPCLQGYMVNKKVKFSIHIMGPKKVLNMKSEGKY